MARSCDLRTSAVCNPLIYYPSLLLSLEINQPSLSNFTSHSYTVIPHCGSPFYCLYYSVFYIPITVATQGRSRSGALLSYISLAVVGSQFKLQLHYSYDDDNLSCLVQDSLLLVLLRLPSSVPSFSSFHRRRNLVFSSSAFLFSLARYHSQASIASFVQRQQPLLFSSRLSLLLTFTTTFKRTKL